jgi:sulfofructose kinase
LGNAPVIAAAGICCLDYIVTSPRVQWGDTSWVSDFRTQGGGLAATALVACARLGADCTFLSLLGDDQIGDTVISELEAERIDTGGVIRVPGGQSPFSFIHVDQATGDRTIFHRKGSFPRGTPEVQATLLSGVQALVIDNIYPALSMASAKICRERGIPVVADLVPGPNNQDILKLIDVLIAPRDYAEQMGLGSDPRTALDRIRQLGPDTAVVTLGSDGCVWADQTGSGDVPAFKVDVVDTTGAGDAFHGAFGYGQARGWSAAKCCEFASAVAAIKCTRPGGRTGLPSLEQTLTFLKDRSKETW